MTSELQVETRPRLCSHCHRYRERIHELAGKLDAIDGIRQSQKAELRWYFKAANDGLRRLYGKRAPYLNSALDRFVIGYGIRTLLNVGVEQLYSKIEPGGWGLSRYRSIRHWFIMTMLIKPLRWLVGVSC